MRRIQHTLSAEFNEWHVTVTTVINQADTHSTRADLPREKQPQTVSVSNKVLQALCSISEYKKGNLNGVRR